MYTGNVTGKYHHRHNLIQNDQRSKPTKTVLNYYDCYQESIQVSDWQHATLWHEWMRMFSSPNFTWFKKSHECICSKSVDWLARWLTSAGAVGANSSISQRRWAAWIHGCCVVILGTASLDGSQVTVAAWSEACWHGQVWRLRVVLRMGTGIPECGLRAAVLIMMAHVQVP